MYAQIKKPKDNKSKAVFNSITQKKSNAKQGFGFVDNSPQNSNIKGIRVGSLQNIQLKRTGVIQRGKTSVSQGGELDDKTQSGHLQSVIGELGNIVGHNDLNEAKGIIQIFSLLVSGVDQYQKSLLEKPFLTLSDITGMGSTFLVMLHKLNELPKVGFFGVILGLLSDAYSTKEAFKSALSNPSTKLVTILSFLEGVLYSIRAVIQILISVITYLSLFSGESDKDNKNKEASDVLNEWCYWLSTLLLFEQSIRSGIVLFKKYGAQPQNNDNYYDIELN